MNATGVQVGNLLKNKGVVTKIDGLSIYHLWAGIEKYEPIPLTEEWVTSSEVLKDTHQWFTMFGAWITKKDNIYWYNVNGSFIELKYLHQFQNLYLDLVGEELTINN